LEILQTELYSLLMESEFITSDIAGEEAEWLRQFWRIYLYGLSQYPQYAFTATTK